MSRIRTAQTPGVIESIPEGFDNRISLEDIQTATGKTGDEVFNEIFTALHDHTDIICYFRGGFFKPTDAPELLSFAALHYYEFNTFTFNRWKMPYVKVLPYF